MRTGCIIYTYNQILSTYEIELRLESHVVGTYPMTYTVQECLEDFCDKVAWKFIVVHVGTLFKGRGGYFHFEQPSEFDSMYVVREFSHSYNLVPLGW